MSAVPAEYVNQIRYASQQTGVPASLLAALLNEESGFNPNAVSPAGAQGIAQFMPATAAAQGVNPLDPNSAILGAAQYLAGGYSQFQSWPLALAAYNAGSGAVQQYGGIPPYAETQNYVSSILNSQSNYSYLDSPSTSTPSGAMNVFDSVLNSAEQLGGPIGTVANVVGAARQGVQTAQAIGSGLSNVTQNFGPFCAAIAFIGLGIFLLAFSWGEELTDVIDKNLSKIGPIVGEIAA